VKVYIAASWRHEHAVRMLTDELRRLGIEVVSFVENEVEAGKIQEEGFNQWVWSDDGEDKFLFDTDGATTSDYVIYLGPSGADAWAEVGIAWACGVPVLGLWAKGEPIGLMRRLVAEWFYHHQSLLVYFEEELKRRGTPR